MITTCMKLGEKTNCAGAASIPATAESAAAKPQPIASIHVTRTPSNRLAVGFTADERSARPIFVNLKNAHRSTTHTRTTSRLNTDCCGTWTSPTLQVPVGNGERSSFSSGFQIQLASPFRITSSAIVAPPRNETRMVKKNAGQKDQPWFVISDQAM